MDETQARTAAARPSRRWRERVTGPPAPSLGAGDLLLAGVGAGLLTGLLEVASLLVRQRLVSEATLGTLQLNRHFAWMIPLFDAALFGALGLALAGLRARLGPAAGRAGLRLYLGLGALGLLLGFRGLHPLAAVVLALGLALRGARVLEVRPGGLRRAVRLGLPALVGVAIAVGWAGHLASGRQVEPAGPPTPGSPNLILVVMDTVRADRTSLHGYARDTTPNLARLAARGVTFDLARAPSPWTLPSHATIFTGRWPHEHSARTDTPLGDEFPTLAEYLRARGYATAGFVANMFFCNAWFGLDRGFARYEDFYEKDEVSIFELARNAELGRRILALGSGAFQTRAGDFSYRKSADRVNADALGWLDGRRAEAPDRPFFLFLNYMDAHDPYVLPPGADRHFGLVPEGPADLAALQDWHETLRREPDARTLQLAADAYDDCLAYLDDRLGRLFAELERRGELDNTAVIVTSDHGEHFGEHGLYLHGNSLYRPLVDVPLLVIPPRGRGPAGARVAAPVSLRAIPATAVDLLGLAEGAPFPGRSLARSWDPDASAGGDAEAGPILSEVDLGVDPPKPGRRPKAPAMLGPMQALVSGGRTYMHMGDGSEALYDLADDPGEDRDLAGRPGEADTLLRLRGELGRAIGRPAGNPSGAEGTGVQ